MHKDGYLQWIKTTAEPVIEDNRIIDSVSFADTSKKKKKFGVPRYKSSTPTLINR